MLHGFQGLFLSEKFGIFRQDNHEQGQGLKCCFYSHRIFDAQLTHLVLASFYGVP